MIITEGTKLMSYGRIEIPKYMRKDMELKTGDRVTLFFQDDHITLYNPVLELKKYSDS